MYLTLYLRLDASTIIISILSQQKITLNHTGVVAPAEGLKVVVAVLAPVHPLAEMVAAGADHISVMESSHQQLLLLTSNTAPGIRRLLNREELKLDYYAVSE